MSASLHPMRAAVLRHVAAAAAPVTVTEVAEAVGLHHTTVRQHLAGLRDAGLVSEEPERGRGGPGRPRLVYRPRAAPDRYRELAVLLAETLGSGRPAVEVGREAGRRTPLPSGPAAPLQRFTDEITVRGFDPVAVDGGLLLRLCPYSEAVAAAPPTVCRLHLGLAEGLAEAIGGLEVSGLEPALDGCRLRVG